MRSPMCILALALIGSAFGQADFARRGAHAQFRNLSGLSGGGYGVDEKGRVNLSGSFTFSTPIGYSMGGGQVSLTLANTSWDRNFRFLEKEREQDFGFESNGTGSLNVGFDSKIGRFTLGMVVVSGSFENAYSVQWMPKQKEGKVQFSLGAQGLFAAGGFIGSGLSEDSADRSTSLFIAGTWAVDNRTHVSFGTGTARFRNGFGSVSYGFCDSAKGFVEYDGFAWNYGMGFSMGSFKLNRDRTARLTGTLAMVSGRYAAWSLNLGF